MLKKAIEKRRLKSDPCYFAREMLGFVPYRAQELVLRDQSPTTNWVAGRGCGKSYVALVYAYWKSFTEKNHVTVFVTSRFGQAKLANEIGLGLISGSPLADFVVESSTERTKFANGATIFYLGAGNSAAVRGFHNRYSRDGSPPGICLIIDEAATTSRDLYAAALSVVNCAPPGRGKCLFVGSPLGQNHWFFGEYTAGLNKAELFTSAYHTPSTACPFVLPERLEEAKAKMSPIEYGAEILAEFQEQLDAFFGGYITPAIHPYKTPVLYHTLGGNEFRASYHLGLDLSTSARAGSDWTALVVIKRWWGGVEQQFIPIDANTDRVVEEHVEPYIQIMDVRRFQVLPLEQLKNELHDLQRKYPRLQRVTTEWYESTQLDAICSGIPPDLDAWGAKPPGYFDDMFRLSVNRLHPTNALQNEAFPYMHQLLRDRVLRLPSDGPNVPQLLRELRAMTYRVTDHGNIVYGACDNEKDDVCYALLWAIWDSKEYQL